MFLHTTDAGEPARAGRTSDAIPGAMQEHAASGEMPSRNAGSHLVIMKRIHRNGDGATKRQKHGRRELRDVKRTLRRPANSEEFGGDGDENKPEKEHEIDVHGSVNGEQEGVDDRGMAYNALLTLLGPGQSEKRAQKSENSHSGADEINEEDLEINFSKSDDESDDEHEPDAASDDEESGEKFNAFDFHFNTPSEDYMEKASQSVANKWKNTSKETIAEYVVSTSTPLCVDHEPVKLGISLLKKRVRDVFSETHDTKISSIDASLLDSMLNYKSILFPYKHYTNTSYRELYSMHAMNHVFKTRDNVLKNTEKIKHAQDLALEGKFHEDKEYRDQGFTRPKVLILLPTRNAAYEVVETILKYSGSEQQENKKKFKAQFYSNEVPPETKPDDFRDAFKGNNNDFFCLGMKFTRKSAKLYSSFYSSDIIIASPLGLSMILENPDKKKRQYDFLSSIEVFIVDRANQIEAQNWAHVNLVLKYLNKVPKEFHDADFSRIRMWYINDQAPLLRQTLVFSEYTTPPITSLVSSKSVNIGGRVRYKPTFTSKNCTINSIGLRLKQIFQRFSSPSPMEDSENRFKFFINSMLPSLTSSTSYSDGILVYIPSYFDYVRIKNYMRNSTKFTFEGIDEYSTQSKLTRYRQQFVSGKVKILLYTERLHYFRRFEINGVKTLLMYGVPSNPIFYKELVRCIGKSVFKEVADIDLSFVKVMYSQWDAIALERIVGGDRAPVLCSGTNEMYEFR